MTKLASLRSALSATTALAGGALLLVANPAAAQSLPDTGNVTQTNSGLGGTPGSTAPTFTPTPTPTGSSLRVDLKNNRTILNWGGTGFDVAAGNNVDFKDARATVNVTNRTDNIAVLNRDLSGGASNILGSITSDANVGVYLLNSNGIIFGANSVVNTGSFTASTRDLTDADFNDGNASLSFSGSGTAGITVTSGAQIRTAANAGTTGDRMGDLILVGGSIATGENSTITANGGNVGMIVADDVRIQNTAGSPLSFTVDRGTAVSGAFKPNGSISGRNVTLGLFTRITVFDDANLDIKGPITATGAAVTDRGVVLVSNAAGPGVTLGSAPSGAAGADINFYGELRIGKYATPGIAVTSASGLYANAQNYFINQGIRVAGLMELAGHISVVDARDSGETVEAGSILFNGSETRLHGTIRSTSGDITFGNIQASVESGRLSSARDILGSGNNLRLGGSTSTPYLVEAARNIDLSGKSAGFYNVTAGGSVTINTLVPGACCAGWFNMTAAGDITVRTSGNFGTMGTTTSTGGKITVNANTIELRDPLTALTGVDLTATSSIKLISASATGTDADVILRAPTLGWITSISGMFGGLPRLSATRDVSVILNGGTLSELGTVTAGRDVTISGASINADSVTATAGAATITGSNLSGLSAAVNIKSLNAATGATVTGKVVDVGAANITNGNLTVTSTDGGAALGTVPSGTTTIVASGNVSLTANGGGQASIYSALTAGGNLTVSGNGIRLGSNILIRAAGAVSMNAGAADLNAGINLTIQSNSDGVGSETLTLETLANYMFGSNSTLLGGTARQSNVYLRWGFNRDLILGSISAKAIYGARGNGAFEAGLVNSTGGIGLAGNIDVTDTLLVQAQRIEQYGTTPTVNVANGNLTVRATNGEVRASAFSASGNLTVASTGGDITLESARTTNGAIDLTATTGNLTVTTASAGTSATLRSVTSGGAAHGTVSVVDLSGGTDVSATGRNVGVRNATATTGNVVITGSGTTRLGGEAGGPTGTTTAGGNVTVTGFAIPTVRGTITAGGDVNFQATTGQLIFASGSTLIGRNITLTALAEHVGIHSNVTASGDYSVTGKGVALGVAGGPAATQTAKGAVMIDSGDAAISGAAGLTLVANSDGIGSEALTLISRTGLTFDGTSVLKAGPARESDLYVRTRGSGGDNYELTFGSVYARGLFGATDSAAFTSGLTRNARIQFLGASAFTNSVSLNSTSTSVADFQVTNGDLTLRSRDGSAVIGSIISASGDVLVQSNSYGVTLNVGAQVNGANVVLSGNGVFNNMAGANAINAAGRWIVYASNPGGSTFGGLNSNATALWNSTIATRAPGTITGNRYVFSFQPTLTVTSTDLSKIYGTNLSGLTGIPYTITGYHPGVSGAFLPDTAATAHTGTPSFTSSGFATRASVAGGPYVIIGGIGSLASASGYNFTFASSGRLTVTPKALTANVTADNKTYDGTTSATGSATLGGVVTGDTVGLTAGTYAFANKNAGTGRTVNVSGISLTGTHAGNYTLTVPATVLADIFRKALTGTATANNKTYDGTTTTTGTVSLGSGVIGSDDVSVTGGTFNFVDKNAGTGKSVIVTGTLSGNDAGNYELTISSGVLADILKKAITGTIAVNPKTYDGTTSGTGAVTLNGTITGDTVRPDGTVFTFADKNAGTGKTVTVTGTTLIGADAGNYTLTLPATALGDILRKALTVTVTANNKTYDGTTAATGSVTLNGVVTGENVGTTTAGFAFTDKNAGTGKTVNVGGISLTGTDAGNYTLTVPATVMADILKKALTGTATANSKTYDGTTATTGTFSFGGGVVGNDDVSVTGATFNFADKNAGTGKSVIVTGSLAGADAGNYTFTISSGVVADILKKAITGSVTANNKTYDGTTTGSGSVTLNGVITGDTVGTTGTTFTFADKNAGTGKTVTVGGTTLNGADGGNYTLTLPASVVAEIFRKALTGTATANSKTYDGTTSTTGTVSLGGGVISGDDVSVTGATYTFADKNAGTGKNVTVTGSLGGADAGNYSFTLNQGVFADILKKALSATVTANNKTYDGTASATGSVTLNGVVTGDTVGTTGTSFAFSDKNAGTGKTVTVTGGALNGADAGNYTLTLPASVLADILKKAITGSVTANNKTYDGTTAATGTVTLNGVITGDTVGTTGTSFAFSDKNAGTSKTVNVTGTTLNGSDAGNYTLTVPASVVAEILRKALTGTATANSKTYDGTTSTTGTVSLGGGVISGDDVSVTGATFTFADKNAGTGKSVTVTGSLGGADAGNYSFTLNQGVLADILKKAITGSVTANNKTYDGTTTGSGTVTLNGVVQGDTVGTSGTSYTFADKNAATGKTVTVAGTTLSGVDAGNYTLTLPASVIADILKKALSLNVTANSKTYDGTAAATGSVTLTGGAVSGDDVGITGGSFAFANKNAGTNKAVSVTGVSLTGADAGNYSFTIPASLVADIFKKALTGTATANDKTYDGTTATTGTVSLGGGVLGGDDVTVTGGTFTFADKNAGTGKSVTVTGTLAGADAGNYDLTISSGVIADILKKAITGGITANNKTYDGTTAGTGSVTLNGVVQGDTVGTSGSVFTFADKNAGTGKTVTITGTALSGADAGNYTLTVPASALADILQKALSLNVTANNKTYDGTTSATGSVAIGSGLVSGDDVGVTGGAFAFANKNAGANKAVSVGGVSLTGADAGNYTFTLPANVVAEIFKKAISGTATANGKTYDGTTATTGSVTLNGVIQGDAVTTSGSTFAFGDKNAGTGKSVTVTPVLGGADAGNYTVTLSGNVVADILKKALTGSVTINGKTYDGTTAATGSVTLNGIVQGDTVSTTGSAFAFTDKNAGTGKTVTITGTTLSGADAGNYTLSIPASALGDIAKRNLTITPDAGQSKDQGEADPVLTYTVTGGSLVSGDAISGALGRAPGELPGNYAILVGSLSAGSNYTLNLGTGTFAIFAKVTDSGELQALKVVTLPAQVPDLGGTGGTTVTVDEEDICAADESCTTGN